MSEWIQKIADWIESHDKIRDWNEATNKSFQKNIKSDGTLNWEGYKKDQQEFEKSQGNTNDTIWEWLTKNYKLAIVGAAALLVLLKD